MSYSIGKTALKTFDVERAVYGKFDGSTNYVSVPDNANLNFGTGDFSVELFFKHRSVISSTQTLVRKGNTTLTYLLRVNTSNQLFIIVGDGTNSVQQAVNTTLVDNSLYHVIMSCSRSGNVVVYINGYAQLTYAISTVGNITNTTELMIGATPIALSDKTYSTVYLTRLHNRALSASEVLAYYNNGRPDLYVIPYSDRWGSQTAIYTSDFSAGVDGWAATSGLSAIDGNVDGIAGENDMLRATSDNSNGFHRTQLTTINQNYASKKLMFSFKYYIPSSNTTIKKIALLYGASFGIGSNQSVVDAWTSVSIVTDWTQTDIRPAFFGITSTDATSFTGTSGDVYYLKDIAIKEVGVVADYRFNEGAGYQIKDYSTNKLHGTLNGTYDNFWQNNKQYFTKEFTFLHSAISSTAATTTLFKLPANVKIKEIIVDPTIAFDTDNTISLGISGNETWLATLTGTNATTPQYANADKMYSPNNEVQLYIKKAGASTTGSITLKFRLENMNWKGCLPCPSIL